MKASGVVRDRLPSADNEMNGLARMELAFLPSSLPLRLWAGAAAVYYDSGLDIYPTADLELYPTNWLTVRAGAGIVADSDPEKERIETVNKAKAIERALMLLNKNKP